MPSTLTVVNPAPTQEQKDATQQAIYDFLAPHASDADETGRNRYFGDATARFIVKYGLTLGGGGALDIGPTLLAQLSRNGGRIYDLAGGDHKAWYLAVYNFLFPRPVPVINPEEGEPVPTTSGGGGSLLPYASVEAWAVALSAQANAAGVDHGDYVTAGSWQAFGEDTYAKLIAAGDDALDYDAWVAAGSPSFTGEGGAGPTGGVPGGGL